VGAHAPESRARSVDFAVCLAEIRIAMNGPISRHTLPRLAPSPARASAGALDPACLGARVLARSA
jgi:hypothetical protein